MSANLQMLETPIAGAKIFIPEVFVDERGFFLESYNKKAFQVASGLDLHFVQDNHSYSQKNVLRGLHYQLEKPQSKLIHVIRGEIYDVIVDMSLSSKTFGRWFGVKLSAANKKTLFVPPYCAHGFLVVSEYADVLYKTTDFYDAPSERCLKFNDSTLAIEWPTDSPPLLSPKDLKGKPFQECPYFP